PRLRRGSQEIGVRECRRRGGQGDRPGGEQENETRTGAHASSRWPPRPISATTATTSPRAPRTSATTDRMDVPPLANDDSVSTRGAGVSELSDGADQSTTEPSE